jgi:hypothetical protein
MLFGPGSELLSRKNSLFESIFSKQGYEFLYLRGKREFLADKDM